MTQKLAVPALKVETLKQRMRGNLALFGGNYLIVGAVFLTLILLSGPSHFHVPPLLFVVPGNGDLCVCVCVLPETLHACWCAGGRSTTVVGSCPGG